jgi:hypothetical protein
VQLQWLLVLSLVVTAVACGSDRSMVAPSAIPSAALAVPSAALAVRTFTVTQGVSPRTGGYGYNVVLQLDETAGRGAWVTGLLFTMPGGYDTTCGLRVRVNANERSWSPPGWCLDFDSPALLSTVRVTVTFSDDDGRSGTFQSATSATNDP